MERKHEPSNREMEDFFVGAKRKTQQYISRHLKKMAMELSAVNSWGRGIASEIADFSSRGKNVRGGLVLLGHEIAGGRGTSVRKAGAGGKAGRNSGSEAVKAAAAMELFHSGLLVHDDIIDMDELRRGRKTTFAKYMEVARKKKYGEALHFGQSVGICAGDICFFEASGILAGLKVMPGQKEKIVRLFSRTLSEVAIAQMKDIELGFSQEKFSEKDILELYRYKTACYTFSLPLMAGAIIGGAGNGTLAGLDAIGQNLGLIFQIKDDEIGLFGSEKETGKPSGSDIRENKKTLYYYHLFYHLFHHPHKNGKKNKDENAGSGGINAEERKRLLRIFGKKGISRSEIDFVRKKVVESGARDAVAGLLEKISREAERAINRLHAGRGHREILLGILDYSMRRKS
jgi:geranylgeranyl diphosphate synthase type I